MDVNTIYSIIIFLFYFLLIHSSYIIQSDVFTIIDFTSDDVVLNNTIYLSKFR